MPQPKSKPKRSSNRVSAARRKRVRKPPVLEFAPGTFAKPAEMPREAMGSIAIPRVVFDRLPDDLPDGGVTPRQLADAVRPRTLLRRIWDFAPTPRWAWWLMAGGAIALSAALLVKGASA